MVLPALAAESVFLPTVLHLELLPEQMLLILSLHLFPLLCLLQVLAVGDTAVKASCKSCQRRKPLHSSENASNGFAWPHRSDSLLTAIPAGHLAAASKPLQMESELQWFLLLSASRYTTVSSESSAVKSAALTSESDRMESGSAVRNCHWLVSPTIPQWHRRIHSKLLEWYTSTGKIAYRPIQRVPWSSQRQDIASIPMSYHRVDHETAVPCRCRAVPQIVPSAVETGNGEKQKRASVPW